MARPWQLLLPLALLLASAEANSADCSGKLVPFTDAALQVGQFFITPPGGRVYLLTANCVVITSAQHSRFPSFEFYVNNKIPGAPPNAFVTYQYVKRFSGSVQDSKFKIGRNDGWYLPKEDGERILAPKLKDKALAVDLAQWNDFFKIARSPVEFNNLLKEEWVAYLKATENDNSAEQYEFWRVPSDLDLSDGVVTNGATQFLTRSTGAPGFTNVLSIPTPRKVKSITLKMDSNVEILSGQDFEFRFE
jgi:hypothetical protein